MKDHADYTKYRCPYDHVEKECGHELHGPEGYEDTYGIWCACGFRGPVFCLDPDELSLKLKDTTPAPQEHDEARCECGCGDPNHALEDDMSTTQLSRVHDEAGELKPCPFCGATPEVKRIGNDHVKEQVCEIACTTFGCFAHQRAGILNGRGHTYEWAEQKCRERWNTRAVEKGGEGCQALTGAEDD